MNPSSLITIAIAEDFELVRNGIIALLQQRHHIKVVCAAANGRELINQIALSPSTPDVCLIDISMPVLNGYDTVLQLITLYPHIRCLALTMMDIEYSIITMIKNGAKGYLLKGCSTEELHQAIISIHQEGYYYSAVASQKTFSVIKNNHLPGLTARELEFVLYCCTALTYVQIATQMCYSVRTIEDYQRRVSEKLHLHSRIEIVLFAIHAGLIQTNKIPSPESN
jgi:two-component system invasion response regulator UvrY